MTHPAATNVLSVGTERTAAGALGIATAAASVREVAPTPPVATALDELSDRLGALEVTFSALNERLRPVMRDDSYDPSPIEAVGPTDPDSIDTRGDVLRRLDSLARGVGNVTRDLDRVIRRLEV